jgi:hypothetical protein
LEFPVPASRPAWNGYLKLSFVSCPIALYPATSAAERLSFRQINRRTGHRLKHKLVDSVTGEEVASLEKARGYETAANEFLLVEDRDIERARSERPPPRSLARGTRASSRSSGSFQWASSAHRISRNRIISRRAVRSVRKPLR